MPAVAETIETVQAAQEGGYKWGFETEIEMEFAPKGLNEDIVRFISAKKNEPAWLLEWRLKAFAMWKKMDEPDWAAVSYPKFDYQDLYYYAAPTKKAGPKSLGRGGSGAAQDLCQAGHPAARAGDPGRCRGRGRNAG
jgi:Fe-S cluster assembly protein SufB